MIDVQDFRLNYPGDGLSPAQRVVTRVLRQHHLTREQLAHECGCARNSIQQILAGKARLSHKMAYRLMRTLFPMSTVNDWHTLAKGVLCWQTVEDYTADMMVKKELKPRNIVRHHMPV